MMAASCSTSRLIVWASCCSRRPTLIPRRSNIGNRPAVRNLHNRSRSATAARLSTADGQTLFFRTNPYSYSSAAPFVLLPGGQSRRLLFSSSSAVIKEESVVVDEAEAESMAAAAAAAAVGAPKVAPYGSWTSPITSKLLTENARSLSEIHLDPTDVGKGIVYWLEGRPSEGGRGVVCSKRNDEAQIVEWTPKDFSARSKVHEYGGGAFTVYNGSVYFVNATDQAVYVQSSPSAGPVCLTPNAKDQRKRYADMVIGGGYLYTVEEEHAAGDPPPREPVNILGQGADFYCCPRLSPDGKHLAWMQWSHPNMPWDSTQIMLADVSSADVGNIRQLAGDDFTNFQYPQFSADGQHLYVIDDRTDWWNVYQYDVGTGKEIGNVWPVESEIGGPHWQFGFSFYSLEPRTAGNSIVMTTKGKLYHLDSIGKESAPVELATGYNSHSLLQYGPQGDVFCLGGASDRPNAVIRYDLAAKKTEIIRQGSDAAPDPAYISIPKEIKFPTGPERKLHAYGWFYEPKNDDFSGPEGTKPPLMIMVHGGPTAQAGSSLDLKRQFWTSRGFAILDVNYRGSTGYGRKFRDQLKGLCGVADIEDCCEGARYLAEQGLVNPKQLCIEGGSAGGYVVCCCVLVPDLFAAAVSRYGISDWEALADDTHKFEAQYFVGLIGPYPERADLYKARSPINFLDKICVPTAFFQGLDDKVVPPNQTEAMFDAVKGKNLPCALMEYEGEGHGFRKAENIELTANGSYYYICRVLGISPSLTIPNEKMEIHNLPASSS